MMSATSSQPSGKGSSIARRITIPGSIIALTGAIVSSYSIWHHIRVRLEGATDAICNLTESLNCDAVASSSYSEVFGTPLGVWGLGYFLALLGILLFIHIRGFTDKYLLNTWGILVHVGILTTIALGGISLFALKSLCPTCLIVYGLCIAQTIQFYLNKSRLSGNPDGKVVLTGLMAACVPVALSVMIYESVEPDITQKVEDQITFSATHGLGSEFYDIPIARSPLSGLGEDYRMGPDSARVVLVEFSDFQCPSCMRMSGPLKEIQKEFKDNVQIVYRNYPLDNSCNPHMPGPMHQFACNMAAAARCAGQQGKFWEMHDKIFANQKNVSTDNLTRWLKETGLSDEVIKNCQNSQSIIDKIKDDIEVGQRIGVSGTPAIYINGYKFIGRGIPSLRAEILRLLR